MSKENKKILFISYFYGLKGCCPAEWADDKVNAISKIGEHTILLTSILSRKCKDENTIHYRIPSLSLIDIRHEINDLKNDNRKIPYIKLAFFLPFMITLGLLLDILQKVVTSGNGGSKWSWAFPAAIVSLYLVLIYNCKKIFSTGGPASAHLAGAFTSFITRRKLICELQDPLTGKDIGRNSRSALLLDFVEKIIIKTASKIVFVTKSAAEYVQNKYNDEKLDIVSVYPGSRVFKSVNCKHEDNILKFIHLGTLYSTRNLNTLTTAIDELITEKKIFDNQIQILNLGEIYGEIKDHHLSKSYIRQESIKPREEAVSLASEFMVSLLVQHSDSRSEGTIPYKTYDYINIGNPIMALTNSNELFNLLESNGHIPIDVNDISKIKEKILLLLNEYNNCKSKVKPMSINILEQTKDMLK